MTKEQTEGPDFGDFQNTITLEQPQRQLLRDNNQKFIIFEFTYPDHFMPQVIAAIDDGWKVSSYNFLYWSKTDAEILTTAPNSVVNHLDAIKELESKGYNLGWWRPDETYCPPIFFDGETDPLPGYNVDPTPERGLPIFGSCVEWTASPKYNLSSGIYTGEYWWKQVMANSGLFYSYPLWHASQYRTTRPIPFADFYAGHEYGAWPVPMLWQFRGTGDPFGLGVSYDLNYEEWEAVA